MSPCIQGIKKSSSEYEEALAIIRTGKTTLASRPRADMAKFEASPIDQLRQEKYKQRRLIEFANRTAIRNDQKVYDTTLNQGRH